MAKNYLNESLPIGNRLGQIGITKYGDTMKIIEYEVTTTYNFSNDI